VEELKSHSGRKVSLQELFQDLRREVLSASNKKQEPVSFGNPGATIALWRRERILMAALGPPLAPAGQDTTDRAQTPSPTGAARLLDESSNYEQRGQSILLQYGEGNHWPDDPLRPAADDFNRAGGFFNRALQTRPSLPVKEIDERLQTSLKARSLLCQGIALAYRGEYDLARQRLESASDADPLAPEPYNALGITYLEQAQYARAIEFFRQSIAQAMDWPYPRHNLALTYVEMGDNAAAESVYRTAIHRTPQYPYLHYNLGVLLQRTNRRTEAESSFQTAIRKFEDQVRAYRERATALSEENPAEHPVAAGEAATALKEAETVLHNEGEAYNALGALWMGERRMSKARRGYEMAWQLNPKLYAAQYNLGVLALRQHRYSDAAQAFETVIKDNPNFPDAQVRLDCARKGETYPRSRDGNEKKRLRRELSACGG
jgi:tetratricopeptide (TPR) repeat protein